MTQRVFLKLLVLIVLVVGVSTAALDLLVRRNWQGSLTSQVFAAAGISLFAGVAVALIGAGIFARRLHKITSFAQQIAAGNLSARLQESGGDEIASLAATIEPPQQKGDQADCVRAGSNRKPVGLAVRNEQ